MKLLKIFLIFGLINGQINSVKSDIIDILDNHSGKIAMFAIGLMLIKPICEFDKIEKAANEKWQKIKPILVNNFKDITFGLGATFAFLLISNELSKKLV